MIRFLTAGESHGPCLTAILEGFPAGLALDVDAINAQLARRQGGHGRNFRQKIEHDQVEVLGGVIYGKTTGAPISLRIENRDWANWKEKWASGELPVLRVPRPGHADYAGVVKYGLEDARIILERASARETAMRVAIGAVARQLLGAFGVELGSYIINIGGIAAQIPEGTPREIWDLAEASPVRCPDPAASAAMVERIDAARRGGDTLGGIFVVEATGVPVGLGSHVQWDRRLDARLAGAILSIQAIKGVEIGPAFENATLPGTQVHDGMYPGENGGVSRRTNRAGGIEGGMSNGETIVVRAAMKPIPTTAQARASVDLATGQATEPIYQRSDWCAAPAAAVIGEAMTAWVLAEALVEKLGGDSLAEMRR